MNGEWKMDLINIIKSINDEGNLNIATTNPFFFYFCPLQY